MHDFLDDLLMMRVPFLGLAAGELDSKHGAKA